MLTLLITVVLGLASLYIYKTVSTLDSITGVNQEYTEINVYVKQDDKARSWQMHPVTPLVFWENWTVLTQMQL